MIVCHISKTFGFRKADNKLLYKDFGIVLYGLHIRITPMLGSDAESYARLMFGDMYDSFTQRLGKPPATGLPKILSHEANDETHAIRLTDDPAFIGWITLQRDEDDRPDIGISMIETQRNKGYGPEAIKLFTNHLWHEYGLSMVYFRVHETNVQSQRAMKKVGAILDKTLPDPREVALLERMPVELRTIPMNLLYYHLDLPTME